MKKYKKGITFGVFDGLTSAHLEILRQSKGMCEYLIVGLSDDEYVQQVKSKNTLLSYEYRKTILESLPFVDKVVRQTYTPNVGDNKPQNVTEYGPEVIFVGAEYKTINWSGKSLELPIEYITHNYKIHTSHIYD